MWASGSWAIATPPKYTVTERKEICIPSEARVLFSKMKELCMPFPVATPVPSLTPHLLRGSFFCSRHPGLSFFCMVNDRFRARVEHALTFWCPSVLLAIQTPWMQESGVCFFLFHPLSLGLGHFRILSRDSITACQFGGFPVSGVGGVFEA